MGQIQMQLDRIRRRWVMIVVIALVAGVGALGASILQGTSYTGKAALTIQSADRSPEQDAVLAQGYADYFNQLSSQEVLRQKAGIGSDVTFSARIAAASPIVYVEATASEANVAAEAATKMAVTFRDDVRDNLGGGVVEDLRGQMAAAQARLAGLPSTSTERTGIQTQLNDLQSRINDIQADSVSNQLQDLQLSAGVAQNSSDAARNTAVALVGGLLVGALAAVAIGRFENRIATASEVNDRLGLEPLAVVTGRRRRGGGRGDVEQQRAQRLRALINLVGSTDIPVPGTVAITSPHPSTAKSEVAVSLAALRALQGQTTLLIQADLDNTTSTGGLAGRPGVADFLAGRPGTALEGKVFTEGRGLLVCPPGSSTQATYQLFSRTQLVDLLRQGKHAADLVIIDAPSVGGSAEGQIVCSVADCTLLVIEEGETRASAATAATDALESAHASVLGAVIVQDGSNLSDLGFLSAEDWRPVPVPVHSGPIPMGPPPGPPYGGRRPARGPASPVPPRSAPPADAEVQNRTAPISRAQLDQALEKNGFAMPQTVAGAPGAGSGAANGSGPDPAASGKNATGSGTSSRGKRTTGSATAPASGKAPSRAAPAGGGTSKPPAGTAKAERPGASTPGAAPAAGKKDASGKGSAAPGSGSTRDKKIGTVALPDDDESAKDGAHQSSATRPSPRPWPNSEAGASENGSPPAGGRASGPSAAEDDKNGNGQATPSLNGAGRDGAAPTVSIKRDR